MNQISTNRYRIFFFILILWLVIASLSYFKEYYSIVIVQGIEVPKYYLVSRSFVKWLIILLYIIGVYYLNTIAPIQDQFSKNIKWHLLFFLFGMIIIPAWASFVYFWIRGNLPDPYPVYMVYGVNFRLELLVLPFLHLFIVMGHWFLNFYQNAIEDKTSFIKQKSDLIKSRLSTLRAKIDPHFLFNTLQGVSNVAYEDKKSAYEMLIALRDLYTKVEEQSNEVFVTVIDELEFIKKYLYLEKRRFKEKLIIEYNVENNCRNARIPKFIVQPLVENSIKHVASQSVNTTHIRINATMFNNSLYLSVEDSGIPNILTDDILMRLENGELGFGLGNVSRRISILGNDANLSFSKSDLGGLCSTIKIHDSMK